MKTEIKNDKKYFIYYCDRNENPDMIALKMMERNDIEGLLPFKYVRQEDEKYFRYEAGEQETLAQWLGRAQYRRDVIELLENLLRLEEEIESYLLEANHICMDTATIIVKNNVCSAAYIPTMEDGQGSLLELVQEILTSVRYALDEDFSYLFELQNAFGRKDIQNREDLKKWLKIIQGEEKADIDIGDAAGGGDAAFREEAVFKEKAVRKELSGAPAGNAFAAIGQEPISVPVDSLEGIFGNLGGKEIKEKKEKKNKREKAEKPDKKEKADKKEKTDSHLGFLSKNRKKEKKDDDMIMGIMRNTLQPGQDAMMPREIINNLERGDVTVMMDAVKTPVLLNMESSMEYSLHGSSYTIGSGTQADIAVQNKTVSRNHARIFQDGGSWYIEDLGSTNGTCVNGEMLRKMEPYKLERGARIRLSNENYVFQLHERTL